MSLSIVMLTHSSCIKLWPAVFDLIYKYLKNIKLNIMTDNANLFKTTVKYDNINIIYEYSEKDTTFFMRYSSIMNMINDKYVINFVDTTFLTNADESKVINLLKTLDLYEIDRLALYSDQEFINYNLKMESVVDMDYNNFITDAKLSKFFYIFSVQPAIWNRKSFIQICDKFSHLTYRQTETPDVQNYTRNNFKVYHLHSNFCEHTSGGSKLVHYFEFVHVGSRWTIDVDGAYNSLKETVFSIIKEYNLEYNPKPLICDKEWHHN